jgi:SAM-dependent methyltransferase
VADQKAHWESVYRTKRPDQVSWYQREATISLDLIRRTVPNPSSPIIDVGGGASTLVDGLLREDYSNVTVLDVSSTAIELARARLGDAASRVRWLEADVLTAALPQAAFDLWHDRAVFHFLVATFAEDGPASCSGLPVARYSAQALHGVFDGGFQLVESIQEQHLTPAGARQSFVYCLCRFTPQVSSGAD